MSRLRMAVGAACCFGALFFGGVAAAGEAQCWQPHEIEAARVRDLQIMLMLGSLKCRATNSDITAKYDKFYEKSGSLDKYNNALKLHFMREGGITGGQDAYNDFITRLANSHTDGMQTAGFCQMADTLLSLATNANESEIAVLARNFSEKPAGVGDACQMAVAAPASAPVPVTAPVPAPAKEVAVASDPAVPVAAATPAPAPQQVTPESAAAALEAAAAALQTAAASLKTQAATPVNAAPADSKPVVQPAVMASAKPVS
ncbi:hypothetical protein [Sphingobium sp. EM0848]|uniref:hypothetical protein n=1 Tax=Sphingobium sp. EM0848 TaxID=2743473 RepID=UPI0021008CF9|nr:hypothetical protein [Sphingobium sp. EM0848]